MPQWLAESVIYEINTGAFSPEGNFAAVVDRLGDLQDLGVNLLWLMPIHPVGQLRSKPPYGSLYAIRDYYGIDPAYGSKEDFRKLVDEAHRRGMRVIIDVVADHSSWDNVLVEQHPDFYKHDASGHVIAPNPDWTDVAALDYGNPNLREYMTGMLEYWLREFHLDGFRCDVAGLVPTDFWEAARVRLERIQPDLAMLAEWDQPELLRKAFDIDYSWPLYQKLKPVMTGHAPAYGIRQVWEEQRARYAPGALHLRFADNHDEQRAATLFGLEGAMAASVLMFTLDGVPMIYNGTEVGDSTESGGEAMFHRLKVFWPIAGRRPEVLPFFRKLVALRRSSRTLQHGELIWLDNSAADHVVTFLRRAEGENLLVAVNLSNCPVPVSLPGGANWSAYTSLFGDVRPDGGFTLPAWRGAVWRGTAG